MLTYIVAKSYAAKFLSICFALFKNYLHTWQGTFSLQSIICHKLSPLLLPATNDLIVGQLLKRSKQNLSPTSEKIDLHDYKYVVKILGYLFK
jgi:hypothetical protein